MSTKFKKLKLEKRNHIGELKGGDYTVTAEGTVIVACPLDGKIASITDRRNRVVNTDPLTIERAIQLPCHWQHWFRINKGIMESSIYCWGDTPPEVYSQKRCSLEGFDS